MVEMVIGAVQILVALVLWFSKRTLNSIEKKQDEMLKEVKATNGRVTKLETQIVEHNIRDDDRFATLHHRLDRALDDSR